MSEERPKETSGDGWRAWCWSDKPEGLGSDLASADTIGGEPFLSDAAWTGTSGVATVLGLERSTSALEGEAARLNLVPKSLRSVVWSLRLRACPRPEAGRCCWFWPSYSDRPAKIQFKSHH